MKKKIISVLCIAACALTLTACTDKKADLLNYIDKMDFAGALDYYDDKIDGSSKESEIIEEIDREMDKSYSKIIEAYNNGEIELNDLEALYDFVRELELDEAELEEFKAEIEELTVSKENYRSAIEKIENEDYDSAEQFLKLVIKNDKCYEDAQAKLSEIDKLRFDKDFENLDELIENHEYEKAYELFQYSNYRDTKEYNELLEKLKASALKYVEETVVDYYEKNEYDKAKELVSGIAYGIGYSEVDEFFPLQENYIDYMIAKADKFHLEKKHQECIAALKTAEENAWEYGPKFEKITEKIEEYVIYVPWKIPDFDWELNTNNPALNIYTDHEINDTSGIQYEHSIFASCNYSSGIASLETVLDRKFTKMTGVISPGSSDYKNFTSYEEERRNVGVIAEVHIQREKNGPFEVIYTSPAMKPDSKPEPFELDVTDVYAIRLAYPNTEADGTNYNATFFDVCFVNEDKDESVQTAETTETQSAASEN